MIRYSTKKEKTWISRQHPRICSAPQRTASRNFGDKEQEEDNVDLVIRRLNEGYYDRLPNGQERKHHAVCIVMDKLGTASLQLDVVRRYLKDLSNQVAHV